jgi:hypothetical protein
MADAKQSNWIPWAIALGAVVLLLRNQESSKENKPENLTATVRKTIPSIRAAYKQAFLDAAAKIESGEIKDQEGWTKFIADNAGAKQREALDRVYEAIDKLDLPASFAGKESEVANINREIAGAW